MYFTLIKLTYGPDITAKPKLRQLVILRSGVSYIYTLPIDFRFRLLIEHM